MIIFRVHAIQRMFQRRISLDDVRRALETGETIESYPDDVPYPSSLVLGWSRSRPLHLVVADNDADRQTIVITVYEPDPDLWDDQYRRVR